MRSYRLRSYRLLGGARITRHGRNRRPRRSKPRSRSYMVDSAMRAPRMHGRVSAARRGLSAANRGQAARNRRVADYGAPDGSTMGARVGTGAPNPPYEPDAVRLEGRNTDDRIGRKDAVHHRGANEVTAWTVPAVKLRANSSETIQLGLPV